MKNQKSKIKNQKLKIKVAPSILAADHSCLGEEIKRVEKAGADLIHIDIMDGHFVPNLTLGPAAVASLRKKTGLAFHLHLMVENPKIFIRPFVESGADLLSFHIESSTPSETTKIIKMVKSFDKKVGLALNPTTAISLIQDYLSQLDFVLIMTVFPGFGGQRFLSRVLPKIKSLRSLFEKDIEVDGGIDPQTAEAVVEAGANILASGTYIFEAKDVKKAIMGFKKIK